MHRPQPKIDSVQDHQFMAAGTVKLGQRLDSQNNAHINHQKETCLMDKSRQSKAVDDQLGR